MSKKVFAEGLWFYPPHERAPDFVKGKLSISADRFVKWLRVQPLDDKGFIKLDITESRESGKYSIAVDDWKPTARAESRGGDRQQERARGGFEDLEGDIPF